MCYLIAFALYMSGLHLLFFVFWLCLCFGLVSGFDICLVYDPFWKAGMILISLYLPSFIFFFCLIHLFPRLVSIVNLYVHVGRVVMLFISH